jgi:RNA polymerase sigma-70 factor, ECF subfamily
VKVAERSLAQFKQTVLPHLDAAYNLARWLMRSGHDAEDAVQESYLRAWRAFGQFRGEDSRAWLLAIVRNTCHSLGRKNKRNDMQPAPESIEASLASEDWDPRELLDRKIEAAELRRAIDSLPQEFREVLVLRELEELSYKQIAAVLKAPLGTVMSRLARGRARLAELLLAQMAEEAS